jgi:hypothetical protein
MQHGLAGGQGWLQAPQWFAQRESSVQLPAAALLGPMRASEPPTMVPASAVNTRRREPPVIRSRTIVSK